MRRAARLFAIAICCAAITGLSLSHPALSQPAFSQPAQGNKRSITEKDIFQFNWIGDPQISPDGSRVAFVKVTVDEKKTGYDTAIWSVSTRGDEEPRRMTDGKHDSSPRWSPDGKWLVFVRTPEARAPEARAPESGGAGAPGHGQSPQLYLLPVSGGGESWKITDLPRGAGGPVWSPDSKMIAFTSDTSPEDLARQHKKDKDPDKDKKDSEDSKPEAGPATAKSADSSDAEHESDVRVITRSVYRINGAGYLDFKHPQHIWMIAAPQSSEDDVKPKQLTTGKYEEEGIMWSPDSSKIYYTTTQVDDPSYVQPHADVYSVAASGGAPAKIATINMAPREMSLSPDGKRLAFCSSINEPVQSYTEPDLWVMDLAADAKPHNLTANYDFDVCSGVGGDQGAPRAGGGDHIVWSGDGNSLIVTTAREGRANLIQVDVASAKISEVTKGNQAVERFRAEKDASGLVALISTPTNIGDLFWIDRAQSSATAPAHPHQ